MCRLTSSVSQELGEVTFSTSETFLLDVELVRVHVPRSGSETKLEGSRCRDAVMGVSSLSPFSGSSLIKLWTLGD